MKTIETHIIKVKRVTYDKLCKLGKYNDTMDDIINRLMSKNKKTKKTKKTK